MSDSREERHVHLMHLDGFQLALDPQSRERAGRKFGAERVRGPLTDEDIGAKLLVRRLEPRGEIHRIAEHGVVSLPLRAHVADNHLAGIDPNPHPQRGAMRAGEARVQIRQHLA